MIYQQNKYVRHGKILNVRSACVENDSFLNNALLLCEITCGQFCIELTLNNLLMRKIIQILKVYQFTVVTRNISQVIN